MKHRILILLICISALGQKPRTASANETIILEQPDSPISITKYSATYKSEERYGDGSMVHRATVKTVGEEKIVAYGLGFFTFDAFKRNMDRSFIGYDMDTVYPDEEQRPAWEQRQSGAYLFRKYGVGIAYVAIARLEDGTIWKADSQNIENQLRDYEFELMELE